MKLGCDPEIFLQDAAKSLKSVVGLVGGTKREPLPLPLGDGYAVQEDNVAVEFNTPPADNATAWSSQINRTIVFLEDFVQSKYNLSFSRLSAALFPEDELMTFEAQQFGCDPDFNAWTGKQNPRPKASDFRLRSAGGHVHIGDIDHFSKEQKFQLIRMMDLFTAVPSTLVDEGELRKELYGKAGACRDKSYGVEYRTLSNYWIFTDELRTWIWNNTAAALDAVQNKTINVDQERDAIFDAVNNNNKDAAKFLIHKYAIGMPNA